MYWKDFKNNIGMRPHKCSADNCQIHHNLQDWIAKEIKNVKTKGDKVSHLWAQSAKWNQKRPVQETKEVSYTV